MIPEKLKKEYKVRLADFSGVSFDKSLFIDEKLLRDMCEISGKTGYEVAVMIDRKGSVVGVDVGNCDSVSIDIDEGQGRLNGIRLIHTHPNGSSNLSKMDLSLLKLKKLDCISAVSVVDCKPYDMQVGYLTGENVSIVKCHNAEYVNKFGLVEKIYETESEYRQYYANCNKMPTQRAILVKVALKDKSRIEADLEELSGLAKTAGIEVVDRVFQFRDRPDATYFIGKGKIDTLKDLIQINECNLVIFDNELSGSKSSNISNALGVKVIDRSMLILDIFASRARTNEGKLQVELAQLKYSLPRLSAYVESSGRFGGGVGMRGPGETKLELNRRIVEQNILRKTEELNKLKKHRELNRTGRKNGSKYVVSIVGYTNSGKSTLLNLLAKSDVYVKDELFATLDTTTRNVWLDYGKEILCTDTVGFINNLPHEFIQAFASTLEESVQSDLILHVVDASDPDMEKKIDVTNGVLKSLGCKSPIILAFNKCDSTPSEKLQYISEKYPSALQISARTGRGIDRLKEELIKQCF